jgi:glycine betaine/proline transport system permease protein
VQEETAKDVSTDTPVTTTRTFWQRLTGNGAASGPSWIVKAAVLVTVLAIVLGGLAIAYNMASEEVREGPLFEFMEDWVFKWDVVKAINVGVDWVVVSWDPFFDFIGKVVLGILVPFRDFLLWLPWWMFIAGVALLAWRVVNLKLSLIVTSFLLIMAVLGLMDLAMETLAVTFTASLLCVIFGIPVGIAAAASNRFDGVSKPFLDGMQTMPSFVYLVPALMLFGLGMVPAVMATMIYAIPPIIRLTNLGIRQVDAQILEASRSFGTTSWQLLTKVQVPLALPTILAGLNQTVMMALAMVVLASMIGARGLGVEVLTGLGRINAGQAFVGGISIVFLAIILDRISQGFAKRPESRPAT